MKIEDDKTEMIIEIAWYAVWVCVFFLIFIITR
jgi:hypothetical protein